MTAREALLSFTRAVLVAVAALALGFLLSAVVRIATTPTPAPRACPLEIDPLDGSVYIRISARHERPAPPTWDDVDS